MKTKPIRFALALAALAALAAVSTPAVAQNLTPGTAPGTSVGPSSSQTPYVVPTAPGWKTISLLTAGDAAKNNGYQMAGIPDGLGAVAGKFDDGKYVADKSYMTVFMNHEILAGDSIVRSHGSNGAFVSQWTIHLNSLEVKWGEDLIQQVYLWDVPSAQYVAGTTSFHRFCSADLPADRAFYNPRTHKGFDGTIFMNGEEGAPQGRAFAHVASGAGKGNSYELPYLGRFAWENSVAHPNAGDKTVVVGLNDSTPGQVFVYIGQKQSTGNPVERAGLVGGALNGIKVTNGGVNYASGAVNMENKGAINGTFSLVNVPHLASPNDWLGDGTKLQTQSNALGITRFARPEDGAWDPNNPKVFYFVVTGANVPNDPPAGGTTGQSARLYKLTFDSVQNPTGGTIEMIVDRKDMGAGPLFAQFDNITVDGDGFVTVLEDPGDTPYLAKIWRVNPAAKTFEQITVSDPDRFNPPTPFPFNQDEESSGVIEVTDLVRNARWYDDDRRYFLADLQAHYSVGAASAQYEGGQLYMIVSPRNDDDDHGRDKD